MEAQPLNCTFKEPLITINFGTGNIADDLNTASLFNYGRVVRYCPTDGHYAYTSFTSDCFRGDWLTIPEDHTPGDVDGNMMLVNASPVSGTFLKTSINGLKGGVTYEFSVFMMNVCKPSDKCPYPLLPDITILLQRPDGKIVTQFGTGELARRNEPKWTRYEALFTTTPSENNLILTMIDNNPGGCGNDFVLDDISFRECVITKPFADTKAKTPVVAKKLTPVSKPVPKKASPPLVKKEPKVSQKVKPRQPLSSQPSGPQQPKVSPTPKLQEEKPADTIASVKPRPVAIPPPPPIVATRSNPLIKLIEAEAGEIRVDLYDNGEIDGDTVSVYHNNVLLVGHARLTEKAITFRITVDAAHPHHELVMVAHNLGSIPPNTSLMVVTAGAKRYEVFISSTEQKNGKVIIDLKE